jgi:hypothetical protein
MKLATVAAALALIGAASLIAPSHSSAQNVPPSVSVPQSQSAPPSNIRGGASKTVGANFTAQQTGSATDSSAMVPVAQRFAPAAAKPVASGAANTK